MDALHRKLSMALGIAPGVATIEQQIDLILERNADLEMKVAMLSLEKVGFQATLLDAMEEVEKEMGECDVKPKTVPGLFAVLLRNLNKRLNQRG